MKGDESEDGAAEGDHVRPTTPMATKTSEITNLLAASRMVRDPCRFPRARPLAVRTYT